MKRVGVDWDAAFQNWRGRSTREIANAFGVSYACVYIAARVRGIKLPRQRRPSQRRDPRKDAVRARLKQLHASGVTNPQDIHANIKDIWPEASIRQIISAMGGVNNRRYVSRGTFGAEKKRENPC